MQYRITILAAMMAFSVNSKAQSFAPYYKGLSESNPISASVFCADPTALEYNGRLYVYGTNDTQQYIKNGKKGGNGYGDISSIVIFSTDDLVNWTFHGTIDVRKLCSSWGWRFAASWAPSVTWRTTADGKEEFFLYFANSGGSVGVLKASSPIGPWSSPLSKPMIDGDTPGVKPCNWIFDPGVVIDDNGTGYIAFGGGDPQKAGAFLFPGNSRIAKLKSSMTALDGAAVNMPAPYLFEASELNMMNGRYVYTYNTSWTSNENNRSDWKQYEKRGSNEAPSSCSMCYMVSDTPLDPSSWEYRGEYVPNEGNFGMGWGNNHTHLHKFKDQYFLFFHSTVLESSMKDKGGMSSEASGYRSLCVNKATVNENAQKIDKMTLSKKGEGAIANLNPYVLQQAETMSNSGGVSYEDFSNITKNTSVSTLGNDASRNLQVKMAAGAWTQVRSVDFGTQGAASFTLRAKGTGTVELRFYPKGKTIATLDFSSTDFEDHTMAVDPTQFTGIQTNIYIVFTAATNVQFDAWQFTEAQTEGITPVEGAPSTEVQLYDLSGRRLTKNRPQQGIVIKQYTDANGVKRSRKVTAY